MIREQTISSDNTDESYSAGARLMEARGLQFPAEAMRKRHDLRQNGQNGQKAEAPTPPLSANLARILEQVEAVQRERDAAVQDLRTANARIEQFKKNEERLASDLESDRNRFESELATERAHTAAAKEEAELARAERVRLETVLAGIRNQAHDALPE